MKNYDQITDRIKELAENPETMSAHIHNNIDGIQQTMPGISQAIANHIVRSVSYLHDKIPKPSGTMPLSKKFEPSTPQMEKFENHYHIVNNPSHALHQIADGTLGSDTMEALKTVHPQLLEQMQHKLKSEIQPDKAEKLPHHVKRGLSQFLGIPLESIDSPAVKMSNQASFVAQEAEKQAAQQGAVKSTQKGLSELKISGRSKTTTQKDEEDND